MNKFLQTSHGVTIHYDMSDNFHPKGCLVFLHGLGGDLTAFDPMRKLFEDDRRSTLAIDIRGQGKSGRPKGKQAYTLDALADDVITILREEKVENFVLIGHCFGGIIAMKVTEKIHDEIKQLILIDTNYQAPGWATFLYKIPFTAHLLPFIISIMPSWYIKTPVDYIQYRGGADYSIPRIFSDVFHTSLRTYLLLSQTLLKLNLTSTVKSFTLPTVIIEGEEDTIYPPRTAEKLHELIPKSELVFLPKANHILVITNYKEVYKLIDLHLRK
jgi:pimeloyl-ACP methyl ester carboxylesterase